MKSVIAMQVHALHVVDGLQAPCKCGLKWSQERDMSKGITKRLSRHRTLTKIVIAEEAHAQKRSPLTTRFTLDDVTATTTLLCNEALLATQKAMQAMILQPHN